MKNFFYLFSSITEIHLIGKNKNVGEKILSSNKNLLNRNLYLYYLLEQDWKGDGTSKEIFIQDCCCR